MPYFFRMVVFIGILVSGLAASAQFPNSIRAPQVMSPWGGRNIEMMATQMLPATNILPISAEEERANGSSLVSQQTRLASQSLPQYLSEPILPEQYLRNSAGPYQGDFPSDPRALVEKASPGRDGVFQQASLTGTWIPASKDGDLGFTDLEASIVFGLPFPTVDAPLLIIPRFGVHYLDGPSSPALPARLYDSSIEWRHLRKLNERWGIDLSVTTGYYSDFEKGSSDAFRITGRGLAAFDWSPTTKVVFGVAYLNRAGATVLPVGGIIFTPNDSVKYELIVPQPRIAKRLERFSSPGVDEFWLYISAEFGGGVWTVEQPGGSIDLIESSDYRAIVGLEHNRPGWIKDRLEVGFIFEREIEFRSGIPNYQPGESFFLRYGLTY